MKQEILVYYDWAKFYVYLCDVGGVPMFFTYLKPLSLIVWNMLAFFQLNKESKGIIHEKAQIKEMSFTLVTEGVDSGQTGLIVISTLRSKAKSKLFLKELVTTYAVLHHFSHVSFIRNVHRTRWNAVLPRRSSAITSPTTSCTKSLHTCLTNLIV